METNVITLLAGGMPIKDVAIATGISEDFIREEIKKPDNTKALVATAKALRAERVESHYLTLEEAALKKASNLLNDDMTSLSDVRGLLETITKNRVAMRNPQAGAYTNPTVNNNSIVLILPQAASAEKVILNGANQVVAIGDRTMAALPIDAVQSMFRKMDDNRTPREYTTIEGETNGRETASTG